MGSDLEEECVPNPGWQEKQTDKAAPSILPSMLILHLGCAGWYVELTRVHKISAAFEITGDSSSLPMSKVYLKLVPKYQPQVIVNQDCQYSA